MKTPNLEELLQGVLTRDPRYAVEAYGFLRAGLDFTVRRLEKPRHVSGQELLDGLREFALAEFGPMAKTVLNGWGIHRTEDIGELVFNLVDSGLLGKTEQDSRDDFAGGYDFDEAFRKPFRPAGVARPEKRGR
jgi:uncharacterized repeat protein (TIGR04138 family)